MGKQLHIAALAWLLLASAAMVQAGDVLSLGTHNRHVRVPAAEAARLGQAGVTVESSIDYGTFVWLELTPAEFDKLAAVGIPYREQADAFTLTLGEQRFDPLQQQPVFEPALAAAAAEAGSALQLVQMKGPAKQEWLDQLAADGLQVVQYIHPFTYVVWGESEARAAAVQRPGERWSGGFVPGFRVQPRFLHLPDVRDQVRVTLIRAADSARTIDQIEQLGGKFDDVRQMDETFDIAGFHLSAARLADVAQIPGVYSVRIVPKDGGLRGEMSNQVCVNNVDGTNLAFPGYQSWLAGVGLSGAGVLIANVDSGVQETHPDLVNRFLPCTGTTCSTAASGHGTHTAGVMAADGSSGTLDSFGFLRGLGMAPGANLIEQRYSPFFQDPGGMLLIMKDSSQNGAALSGNSWGPAGTPQGYDDDTRQVDVGVRDADNVTPGHQPLSFVLSFMNGNGGTSTQGSPDEAKNVFTIGSTKMQNSSGSQILQIDDISANSAHGPALDGRKIPHLVAPGCSVDSTVPTDSYAVSSYCGTSMASPHVSGSVALFIEYYRGLPDYVEDPSPALIKAAFTASARSLVGHLDADGGTLGHPFDSKQGWGRLDAESVLDPAVTVRYFDNPQLLDNTGEEWTATVAAFDPDQPVKIMLVWTDAPGHGLGGNTPAWNNDLDLVVEDGGTTYRGNNFGGSGFSMAGGVADDRNNTEGVFIGPTAPGSYTIRVQASDINSDAIPGVGDGTDQDFAVVCYNCAEEPGFTLAAAPSTSEVCAPNDAEFNVGVGSILGFSNPVTLSASGQPAGTTVTFVPNPVTPGNASTMTVSNTGAAAGGTYPITIQGEDPISMEMKTRNVTLKLFTGLPTAPGLLSPADGALDVSIAPELSWSASADASSYTVDIARDAAFADIVYSAITGATTESVGSALDTATEHFWRVTPSNACGSGGSSSTFSFTTADFPPVLLVDDDDNNPNVQNTYVNALNNLGVDYDLWNTMNSDNEPDAQTLGLYKLVIWFTGDEFGGAAGPGAAGEAALATYLDGGGCLFITAQDYPYDRGNTPFMMNYLGLASYNNDVGHTTATGTGSIFSGFGPFTLSYPFSNFSDRLNPSAGGELAFSGSAGNAAISRDNGVYRTVYFGFPWEAISGAANREAVLSAILDPCTFVTANVVASRSCADHGGTSYCTALSDGDIEPRTSGATRLEFDLDGPVSSVSAVVVCDANPYGGTATVNAPGGSSISVEFNPALPDQDCCEVALSGDAAGSIVISTLAGDVDRNGNVNTADITVVKPKLGQMVGASNYFYDVDANGAINTADITAVKPLLGHAGAVCP